MRKSFRLRGANLTIFSRLLLVTLAVLFMTTAVGVYAIVQLGHVRKVTDRIILVQNVLIDRYTDMSSALLSETRYAKMFALLQDPALYNGFLAAKADFDKYLGEALELADSQVVQDTLKRVEELNQTYQRLFEAEITAQQSGRPAAGKARERDKERVIDEAMDELAHLRAWGQQNILRKIRKLDATGARARTVVMAITVAALLCGTVLSVGITRSIILPLSRMRKKTAEIAEGIFEADLDLASPPEIGALAGAINTMCLRLKEVDRMKSDFYSLMSHELRTPLTSIREGTDMFLEGLGGEMTETQRELMLIISEESSRLIELVNRLLELSKLEAGVLAINLCSTELSPLIARTLREVAPLAAAKNIVIESNVEELPPLPLDAERILQVLRNLLGNALKFTPPGGRVQVAAHRTETEVSVSVTDTGPGIPGQELDAVFEKFRQASTASSLRVQGTGLGLAIVRHIVQAHGGRVWVESKVGQGSTFTFALPV